MPGMVHHLLHQMHKGCRRINMQAASKAREDTASGQAAQLELWRQEAADMAQVGCPSLFKLSLNILKRAK